MGLLVNAEGLPVESIDRIQITLNPELYQYIDWTKQHIDSNNYLTLRHTNKYREWWNLSIQAQCLAPFVNVPLSIANSIHTLIAKGFIKLPAELPLQFIYKHLDCFVYSLRELEIAFDFIPIMVTVLFPKILSFYKDVFYSDDWRVKHNKPSRKSFIALYNRIGRLKAGYVLKVLTHKQRWIRVRHIWRGIW